MYFTLSSGAKTNTGSKNISLLEGYNVKESYPILFLFLALNDARRLDFVF